MVLAVGLPIYLLYWNLFRPVLLRRLKYRLFQTRDELRMFLIGGQIGEKEKAYPLVEKFCNKSISKIDEVDLSSLFSPKIDQRTLLETKRDLEIVFNAGAQARQCFLHALTCVFGAACANSPGILFLIAPVVVFSVTALWFNKVKVWFINLLTRAVGNLCIQPA